MLSDRMCLGDSNGDNQDDLLDFEILEEEIKHRCRPGSRRFLR
jgi:hypothetical protein